MCMRRSTRSAKSSHSPTTALEQGPGSEESVNRSRLHFGHPITRRGFTVLAAGGLASLALPGCGTQGPSAKQIPGGSVLPHAGEESTSVMLSGVRRGAGDKATLAAVRAAALAATDFSWLSRGDTVLIKPVCNSGNDYPATTDQNALHAMTALLRERGAGRVIVADMSGVEFVRFSKTQLRGSTRELMHRNGMVQAVEAAGGEIHAFEERGWDAFFEDRPAAAGSWLQPIMILTSSSVLMTAICCSTLRNGGNSTSRIFTTLIALTATYFRNSADFRMRGILS